MFNPSPGKGRSLKQKEKIQRCLKEKNIDFDLMVTESEDDLRQLAGEKAKEYEKIVGVGGDTTFNIIAGEILKYRGPIPALGMIGTGSTNDIVRGLKSGQENGLFDGVLDCCVIHTKSFLNTFLTGMRVQKGKHTGREEVTLLQAASFKISSKQAIDIQVDGDIIEGVRELEVSVFPGALRVLSNHSNI